MIATMMQVPLSLNHLPDRAGKLFGGNQIVGRLPDRMHNLDLRPMSDKIGWIAGDVQDRFPRQAARAISLLTGADRSFTDFSMA